MIRGTSRHFNFYESFFEKLKSMNDKTTKECLMALCDYGFTHEKKDWQGAVKDFMDHAVPLMGSGFREV